MMHWPLGQSLSTVHMHDGVMPSPMMPLQLLSMPLQTSMAGRTWPTQSPQVRSAWHVWTPFLQIEWADAGFFRSLSAPP
jgi:hypothetical protein